MEKIEAGHFRLKGRYKAFAAGIGVLLSGRRPSDVPCIAPGSLSDPGGFDATVDWMHGDIGPKALRVIMRPFIRSSLWGLCGTNRGAQKIPHAYEL